MPRLQSSTKIVLKPSSWAWKAVEAAKQTFNYKYSTTPLLQLTDTDVSCDATNENIGAALVSYELLQASLAELGVI